MQKLTLSASKRTVLGRKVKNLRKSGFMPANIYGKKVKSQVVQVDKKNFVKLYSQAGETTLVELTVDKETKPVLIHNLQYHPVTGEPIHADFFQVDLKEKVAAKVPVEVVGEAPVVKDKAGVLLNLLSEIEVEALPTDLPDRIQVKVDSLKTVGESLKVADLKVSDKVKVLTDGNLEVVKIAPLISKEAEELTKAQEAAAAAAQAQAAPEGAAEETKEPQAPPQKTPQETPETKKE